jgi:hypothetical protein
MGKPSVISRLTPVNLAEEMAKFFSSSGYNPQFVYRGDPSEIHQRPVDTRFVNAARYIIGKSNEMNVERTCPLIDPPTLRNIVLNYLSLMGLQDSVDVEISMSPVSVASVSRGTRPKVHISPLPVSASIVKSVCAHELGTHLLRMLNDDHQMWGKGGRRAAFSLKPHHNTEEGLACLNGLVLFSPDSPPLLFHAALRYLAVVLAQDSDFVGLFKQLSNHILDKEECFRFCARAKRGVTNTAIPRASGCMKDQSYLIGAIDILSNIESIDFVALYAGLIDREDCVRLKNVLRVEGIRLPPFLQSQARLAMYKKRLRQIAEVNNIAVLADAPLGRSICLRKSSVRRLNSYCRGKLNLRTTSSKHHHCDDLRRGKSSQTLEISECG